MQSSHKAASFPDIVSPDQIRSFNLLLRNRFKNAQATLEVRQVDETFCDLIIDTGIKGLLHDEYIEYILKPLLFRKMYVLFYEQRKKCGKEVDCQIARNSSSSGLVSIRLVMKNVTKEVFLSPDFISADGESDNGRYFSTFQYENPESVSVYKELSEQHLTDQYPEWQPKNKGFAPGVILSGQGKEGQLKKMYVKLITSYNEAYDHAVLTIGRASGMRMPKTYVKSTTNSSYLFSRSLDYGKGTKKHVYFDISECLIDPDVYVDARQYILYRGRQADGNFIQAIPINKTSAARLFITCLIFGLTDIQLSNLGIVITENCGVKSAKYSLVDFEVQENFTISEDLQQKESIKNMVNIYINKFIRQLCTNKEFLFQLAAQLDEEDYRKAFIKFNLHFESACEAVIPELNGLLVKLGEEQMTGAVAYTCTHWRDNFNYLREILLPSHEPRLVCK